MIKSKRIQTLEAKLNQLNSKHNAKTSDIDDALRTEYHKQFEKRLRTEIKEALISLDNSNDYCFDHYGEIRHYVSAHALLDLVPENAREYFNEYLSNGYCAYVDWENDTIYYLNSEEIIINDDGDVYESGTGKFFIKHTDYEDETQRNALIEAHMEKTGYYPGVYSADRHGNVFPVNTQNSQK